MFQIAKTKTFVQIMHLKFIFLTSDDIKNYYQLVAKQLQDSTLSFESNCDDIGISILASQSKIFLSLFEFKDNDTAVYGSHH